MKAGTNALSIPSFRTHLYFFVPPYQETFLSVNGVSDIAQRDQHVAQMQMINSLMLFGRISNTRHCRL